MIYAICNPTAGNGRGRKIGQEIEKRLLEQHYACHLEMTKAPGHATELAYAAAQSGAETVLAIGGDGTAVEVARGLIGTPAALVRATILSKPWGCPRTLWPRWILCWLIRHGIRTWAM